VRSGSVEPLPSRLSLISASTTLFLVAGGVIAIPVRQAQAEDGCDPNYADTCVPIVSDVDCARGSGNGPEYVQGPRRVIGVDIYDLDRDGDRIVCDRQ
jgi:hypothetical protein